LALSDVLPLCRLSPEGQRFVVKWGSNRFAVSGAAILLMWARLPSEMRGASSVDTHSAECAAVKQLHYMAGDNDHGSFIVGFGSNAPVRNHHRNSICAPWEQADNPEHSCAQYAPCLRGILGFGRLKLQPSERQTPRRGMFGSRRDDHMCD
jgi:Glycosyl hydrolase family 9